MARKGNPISLTLSRSSDSSWFCSLFKRIWDLISLFKKIRAGVSLSTGLLGGIGAMLGGDWELTLTVPGLIFLMKELLDWLTSSMDRLPLSVGGGGNSQISSTKPDFYLNLPLPPEGVLPEHPIDLTGTDEAKPIPDLDLNRPLTPEPAPPAPLEEAILLKKRERVKVELRSLLQIGYQKKARPFRIVEKFIEKIGIDDDRDPRFLDDLYDHLDTLGRIQGGNVELPQKLCEKGLKQLHCWILEPKANRAGGQGGMTN
jgi:hypothetical protein